MSSVLSSSETIDVGAFREGMEAVLRTMLDEVLSIRPQSFTPAEIPELIIGLMELTLKTHAGQVLHLAGYSEAALKVALSQQPRESVLAHATEKIGPAQYFRAFIDVTQQVMRSFFTTVQPSLEKDEQQQIVEKVMKHFHQQVGSGA